MLYFDKKTAQEVRIRSDSGNGVDQPQAVTVSVKAEALLYAAFAVLVALIAYIFSGAAQTSDQVIWSFSRRITKKPMQPRKGPHRL